MLSLKNTVAFHLLFFSSFIVGMEQQLDMPLSLDVKLHEKQLNPRCAFLASVDENDCASVQWMLQNFPIPQDKNPLDYFSIYPSEVFQENITPMAVVHHKQVFEVGEILLPLAPISHTVRPSHERRPGELDMLYMSTVLGRDTVAISILSSLESDPGIIDGPCGRAPFYKSKPLYPLYLAACSKNLASCMPIIRALQPSSNSHTGVIQFLLLIITMNNDTKGLHLIKNLLFQNRENVLDAWLGMTFTCAIGLGKNRVPFNTEDEINQLMNYPILKDKKPILLAMLYVIAAAVNESCGNDMLNNVQVKKALKIVGDAITAEHLAQEVVRLGWKN